MIGGRRAQSAIEFLTTYGWALLVIAIVLVALGWLGVFSPQSAVQEYCQFPVGTLDCKDVVVYNNVYSAIGYGTDQYSSLNIPLLEVTNNFGKDIYVCRVLCSAAEPDPATGTPAFEGLITVSACGNIPGRRLRSGDSADIGWSNIIYDTNQLPVSAVSCYGKGDNYWHLGVKVGDIYDGKIYVFYSYAGEVTGKPRMIVGDLRTKIQAKIG